MRWTIGEADVERLLHAGDLQQVAGARADGTAWIDRARRTLVTASGIATDDPESAFVLAYDAARHAGTGLLAHQGLRPTSKGGHYAVEQVEITAALATAAGLVDAAARLLAELSPF